MKYTHISVRFPEALDMEIEQFLNETGVYTNKSEFIKEACWTHLCQLNSEAAITLFVPRSCSLAPNRSLQI
jgi:antitoxin ParD1/3/4